MEFMFSYSHWGLHERRPSAPYMNPIPVDALEILRPGMITYYKDGKPWTRQEWMDYARRTGQEWTDYVERTRKEFSGSPRPESYRERPVEQTEPENFYSTGSCAHMGHP